QEALEIHFILVERFGGSEGVRDKALLESALNRPFQTFDGNQLYPTAVDKAAAIMESIVRNHPFVDGNKRTGYVLGRLLLMEDQLDISAEQDQKYEFVIGISTGNLNFEQIREWLEKNSR
ncbi:MAG: type II toxin-antitoxin system death-on-curing family toxin, partial [Cyclobacteriaceae bacterium]